MLIADGGGGGSFADVINPLSSASMGAAVQSVTAETQKLVDAAKGGGFKITPEGVKPLRDALMELVNDLTNLGYDATALDQAPQLGNHPYGHAVAKHDQKSASDAEGSAKAVLSQLQQVAKQADEALARAAGLYKETEDQAFSSLQTRQA
ncbi:hypothetical protein [Amycolatopsis australiensis]|uniref:Excreted virulence factor EspC, type VII ESX diderm n=1 Tax=Amycolatopsis australiensis TaxID=546364 RepID=A0A1K1PT66_9PSEU|nr:hypothetical protein [Amycolatopsis australiensis]SFW50831.1 hypothetical protein SAMN04489730_0997 [Amycolatopsis australiensis]